MKKSQQNILLVIVIIAMLVLIAFLTRNAYRQGQQDGMSHSDRQTNQSNR